MATDATAAPAENFNYLGHILYHPLFIPLCIGLGLLLRIAVALMFPIEPASDAAWYVARAHELLAGMGYQEGGHPTAYWPIGWPAILAGSLAIFGSVPLSILVINTVSAALVMWLIVWFARTLTGSEWVARVALLAYAIYPNHIAYHGAANCETLYLAIAMLAFMLLIKGRDNLLGLVVCGLIFGVATLVKPQTLAFPLGAVIALGIVYPAYSWLKVLRSAVIVYLFLLLLVSPWSLRNFNVFGEWILVSTNGGVALYTGANDDTTGDYYDHENPDTFESNYGIPWEQRVERQVELNKNYKALSHEWIGSHKLEWLSWMPKKVFILWQKDTDGFWSFQRDYPASTGTIFYLQLLNQLYYLAMLALALMAAVAIARAILVRDERLMPLGLLLCMPLFVSLISAVFTGQIRYHHPAMPFVMILAAWCLNRMIEYKFNFSGRIKND
ncbi:hypothetical protein G8770_03815 [Aestuariicella hydrocarbonica]|uniref:Glycosyltransferase RgtA/B/C/D-like domain-containing protein n=1 Tax=Pseudomaricurvus hydrocarbonicus TaxID=1470433 RepID=A0A9E5MLU4_9GAMM|nr:glycosyltransferase family 39 protein [Aestuariicella hydrocarbonica]NHO64670.1 hypothetical protein [Aestuariicella hydrocarbonica]